MNVKRLMLAAAAALLVGCVDIPKEPDMQISLPVAGTEQTWNSADHAGQPVLVSFMATFCPYCKKSLPALDGVTETFKGKGVEVVGVFVDEDAATVNQVIKDFNVQSTILYNAREAAGKMGVTGFPQIMLFDKDHKLVKIWNGYSTDLQQTMTAEINKVL